MKTLTICLALLMYGVISNGQTLNTQNPALSVSKTNNQVASIVKTEKSGYQKAYHYYEYNDPCLRYHRMKIAGIVLTSAGGGFFIAGAAMMAHGERDVVYEGNGYYYTRYSSLASAGSGLMTLGVIGLGAGIPLTVIGCVKGRRCENRGDDVRYNRSYLQLQSDDAGFGLGLKF